VNFGSYLVLIAGSAGLIYITKMMTGARAGLAGGLYGTFIQLGFSLGPTVGTIGLRKSNPVEGFCDAY
jgi:hypothetical protein